MISLLFDKDLVDLEFLRLVIFVIYSEYLEIFIKSPPDCDTPSPFKSKISKIASVTNLIVDFSSPDRSTIHVLTVGLMQLG